VQDKAESKLMKTSVKMTRFLYFLLLTNYLTALFFICCICVFFSLFGCRYFWVRIDGNPAYRLWDVT